MKRHVTSILALCAMSIPAVSYCIELKEAMEYAYQYNPVLQSAREEQKMQDESYMKAFAGWMPTVFANITTSRQRSKTKNYLPAIAYGGKTNPVSQNIQLNQNLFAGGGTVAGLNYARNLILAGQYSLKNTEQQVLTNVVNAYIDLVNAQESLRLYQNNEKVMYESLVLAQESFKLGEVTRTDVAQATSAHADAISSRIQAEGALSSAKAVFTHNVGLSPENIVMPATGPDVPENIDQVILMALEKNPTMKAQEYQSTALKSAISSSMSVLSPKVDVQGTIQKSKDNLGVSGQGKSSNFNSTLQIGLSVPLYQGGDEYAGIRGAKYQFEKSKEDIRETKESVYQNAVQTWDSFKVAKAQITSTQASVDANKIAVEGVEQEAQEGTRTTLDVLNAKNLMLKSQINHVNARCNEVKSRFAIKAVMGENTAQYHGLDVKIYDPETHFASVKFKIFGVATEKSGKEQ